MPHLKKDASADVIATLDAIEKTADECFRPLRILRYPSNVGLWALMVGAIKIAERAQSGPGGTTTARFDAALINAGRFLPIALKWVHHYGWNPVEPLNPRWTGELAEAVDEALAVAGKYSHFEACFPLYHKDRYSVAVLSPTHARFSSGGSARDRQVSAYQKGIRPREGAFAARRRANLSQTPHVANLFQDVFDTARGTSALSFHYTLSSNLSGELLKEYKERIGLASRRSLTLSMGNYSLEDFNNFYVALLTVCGAHDHLCFAWGKAVGTYPLESAVLVRSTAQWIETLSSLSSVDRTKCSAIIDDLTFRFDSSVDLRLQPFVPVDRGNLAVAPPFTLSSRHDENILRVLSQLRKSAFDDTSSAKEEETLAALRKSAGDRHSIQGSVALPNPVPNIDLLIVDENAAALTIIELKWIRKIVRTTEIPQRDAEVLKGIQQLENIRQFIEDNQNHLAAIRKIARPISHYEHVSYLLVARDHWLWVEPSREIAIVEYEAFVQALERFNHIHEVVDELLKYEWLPLEGRDFDVRYDAASVNGVTIESEVFYAAP